ncbi:serine/threonine-protein kinase rio1-like [Papaver somniferum]|uniref:serine/threonine-protein kinase rio1-like n=1 Tax=Papaver somniferum TaxID=3469 RepID=UPI000E6F97EB|nr:serine/threonine-protein kinase rio1-like [Papaver somniferum]
MYLEEFSETEIGEALDLLDSSKDNGAAIHLYSRRPNAHGGHLLSRPLQPLLNRSQKFTGHLRPSPLEEWEDKENRSMPNSATTANLQSLTRKTKTTDKRDRATVEQDIDPRTRMVLFKMLNPGIFDLNGCISTGKEANVYHATKDDGQEFAVKVYKTSVPAFKDGDRYIQGDYCFRRGYLKHNPRQMPKTWAENEMRNLMRLKAAGIRCPTPIFLRLHVLVIEFIGKSGRAAPCLKDANLSEDKMGECYVQMIMVMRNLYQKCNLMHGDLSEYSILYYEGSLHVIDVSESVDLDHPLASYFLRLDCKHVSDFFRKNGVKVLSARELFDFIVDSSITDESVHSYLEEVQREILVWRDAMSRLISVESDILWGPDTVGLLYLSPAPKQLSNDTSTGQTNNFGTESGTDEHDKEEENNDDDSEGLEPYDTRKEGTRETVIPADKKAARKENKKKVKE